MSWQKTQTTKKKKYENLNEVLQKLEFELYLKALIKVQRQEAGILTYPKVINRCKKQ